MNVPSEANCPAESHRAPRADRWRLRTRELRFGPLPMLMGIVNVTPDSFSDGGHFLEPRAAVDHALGLAEAGAAILDIGGESTRPYADPLGADEELRRVMPVLEVLCGQTDAVISIDTSKARVAREAIAAGAEIINDVTGLEGDSEMIGLALDTEVGVCAMHMQGTPQTMQDAPRYADVVQDIFRYMAQRRDAITGSGIDPARICLDPGIGFGKTHQHNLTLLAASHQFHELGCPLLVGPSRKGFIAHVLGDKQTERLAGTIGVALALARHGIQVLRVHDVRQVHQALKLFAAAGGLE